MPNPGAFQGSRDTFLAAQADLYAEAVVKNHVADTVADIQRRYFKRFPITLAHNEEPGDEWLAQVDDNAPEVDLEAPNPDALDADSFVAAQAKYKDQLKDIRFRKGQISRRLKYQHTKTQTLPKFHGGTEDPMFVLMSRLTGIDPQKPRRKTGYNVWAPSNRDTLDALVEQRAKESDISGRHKIGLRTRIYKEAYDALDDADKVEWEAKAKSEHEEALAKLEDAIHDPPSTKPEDRQTVIEGLPKFVQPIIDLIGDYTGWKVTLIAGGPEPADNGRLNMISMHSGLTSGSVPMNFGKSERGPYKEFVVPVFANFLKKCYTIEECRAAALPVKQNSLADMLNEEPSSFDIHSTEDYVRLSGPSRNGIHSISRPTTPRPPFQEQQNQLGSQTPAPYKIPAKIGPPVHAKKGLWSTPKGPLESPAPSHVARPAPARTTSIPSRVTFAAPREPSSAPSPMPSPARSAAPRVPSPAVSHIPSPAPSRAPSPAVSHVPSPAPSRAPSPAVSRVPSPLPPRVPSPAPSPTPSQRPAPALPQVQGRVPSPSPVQKSNGKRGREVGSDDDSRRMRLRLSRMQAELDVSTRSGTNTNINTHTDLSPRDNGDRDKAGTDIPLSSVGYPVTPAGCPDWFKKGLVLFGSNDLGDVWTNLVTLWAEFEQKSLYTEAGILRNQGRPSFVADWIRYARSPTYRPKTIKLETFDRTFWTWWRGLQPEWRIDDGSGVLPRIEGDLDGIRKPGKNGLFSVLAVLFFWGLAAEKEDGVGGEQHWKAAVDDVAWVLQGLLGSTSDEAS